MNPIPFATLVLLLGTVSVRLQEEPESKWNQADLEAKTRAVMDEVAELRGESFLSPVAVKLASKADFIAYVEHMEEEIFPPDYADAGEVVMKMLGLLEPDFDVDAVTQTMLEKLVAGFYDPFSGTFYLAEMIEPGAEAVFLAHELTHALDDQLFDLTAGLRARVGSADELLAYRAVVEGSGTNLMSVWLQEHLKDIDVGEVMRLQTESMEALSEVPPVLWQPLLWAYNGGADFLVKSDKPGHGQTVLAEGSVIRSAFDDPPRSSEQVIHPEKYWVDSPGERDEPVAVELVFDDLPGGWKARLVDTLGELGVAQISTPLPDREARSQNVMALISTSPTNVFAAGWGGDRVVLLENDRGARIVHAVTFWDSERDAGEFLAAMQMLGGHIEENVRGYLDEDRRSRKSSAGFDVRYGERANEVRLTVHYGVGRTQVRKVVAAIGVVLPDR